MIVLHIQKIVYNEEDHKKRNKEPTAMPVFKVTQFNRNDRTVWILETHSTGFYVDDAVFHNPLALLKFKAAILRHVKAVRLNRNN